MPVLSITMSFGVFAGGREMSGSTEFRGLKRLPIFGNALPKRAPMMGNRVSDQNRTSNGDRTVGYTTTPCRGASVAGYFEGSICETPGNAMYGEPGAAELSALLTTRAERFDINRPMCQKSAREVDRRDGDSLSFSS